MSLPVDKTFFRCRTDVPCKVGLVIPKEAVMHSNLADQMSKLGLQNVPPTQPPTSFSFHYLDFPLLPEQLKDDATLDNGVYQFSIRDGVLAVFEQPFSAINEFCWAFSTTAQIDVLAALRVGETLRVEFDEKFDATEHVAKYHFPPGIPESGYGSYAFGTQVGLQHSGLTIVSSYEPRSPRTSSRLPFFMGFRVFGRRESEVDLPLWRDLLGRAIREALQQRWSHAVLFSAFALESFIDDKLAKQLAKAGLGQEYTYHALQVAERKKELHGLNNISNRLSKKEVNKEYEELNQAVFSPRNKLAHGNRRATDFAEPDAAKAIKAVIRYMWDSDESQRHFLIPKVPVGSTEHLIDKELLDACVAET